MTTSFHCSKLAFGPTLRGEFDHVHVKIETISGKSKYTFLTDKELGYKFIRCIKYLANKLHYGGPTITWAKSREVKRIYEQFLSDKLGTASKIHRGLRKAAYLGKNMTRIEKNYPCSGCILESQYFREIGCIDPEHYSVSMHYDEVIQYYKDHCKDPNIDMLSWYATEEGKKILLEQKGTSDINAFRVKCLSESERQTYSVQYKQIGGEVVLFSGGEPLKTNPIPVPDEEGGTRCSNCPNGLSMFVMGPDAQLYVGTYYPGSFHHSSFFGGQALISAGEIITDATGKILFLSNKSGHYRPNQQSTFHLLEQLQRNGVNLRDITLLMYLSAITRGRFNAEEYLATKGACKPISNGMTLTLANGTIIPDHLMPW